MSRREAETPKRGRGRPLGSIAIVAIFLVLVVLSLLRPFGAGADDEKLTVGQFHEKLITGEIAKFTFESEGEIKGEFRTPGRQAPKEKPGGFLGNPFGDAPDVKRFHLYFPEMRDQLERYQRRVRQVDESGPIEASKFADRLNAKTIHPTEAIFLSKRTDKGEQRTRLFVNYIDETGSSRYTEIVASKPAADAANATGGVAQNTSGAPMPAISSDITKLAAIFSTLNVRTDVLPIDASIETVAPNSLLPTLLTVFGPWILILIIFWFIVGRQIRNSGAGGGILGFGRSRAVLYTKENRTNVTFDDVAGINEAKDEVKEVIEFLKNPQRFSRLGGRIPRGILLVGPPGTGKTLLAKAIAGEAEVPFFSISGSDFVEMFVGVGASRVRDLFKQAKENAPCIIFLDEIDAVGRKRGGGFTGAHDEREQTLNAILVEMDGFDTNEGIIVISSTNRPDVLDPALLRPGRFDREVVIDLPDVKGREDILRVHARRIKLAPDIELHTIARATPMFSGADLAALMNEAAIIAVLKKRDAVAQEDLEEARDKVRFGRQKKSRVMKEEERVLIARHEAGHALVATLMEGAEPVHKVTIIPRGMTGGATMFLPENDRMGYTLKEAKANLCVSYGGRVAEELLQGDISTGAASDISQATRIARMMVCEWGFSTKIGPLNYGERQGSEFLGSEFVAGRFHSDNTAREIDEEVTRICNDAYQYTKNLLMARVSELELVAKALLQYETISGVELRKLLDGTPMDQLRPEATVPPTAVAKPRPEPPRLGSLPNTGLAPA